MQFMDKYFRQQLWLSLAEAFSSVFLPRSTRSWGCFCLNLSSPPLFTPLSSTHCGLEVHPQAWGLPPPHPSPRGSHKQMPPCYKPPEQRWFSQQTQEVNDVPVKNMTPSTSLLFLFSSHSICSIHLHSSVLLCGNRLRQGARMCLIYYSSENL